MWLHRLLCLLGLHTFVPTRPYLRTCGSCGTHRYNSSKAHAYLRERHG